MKKVKWVRFGKNKTETREHTKRALLNEFPNYKIKKLDVKLKRSNVPEYTFGKMKAFTIYATLEKKKRKK